MTAAELAWAAIDHITANPDAYDGLVWISRGHGPMVADFAGRVCLIAGETPDFDDDANETAWLRTDTGGMVLVSFRAKQLLGIDPYDECETLPETAAEVEKRFGPRPAPATEVERAARHRVEEEDAGTEEEAPAKPRRWARWRIVSQRSERRDVTVAWHPWEWTAELHAHWLSGRGSNRVTGVFYTVYPAVKP